MYTNLENCILFKGLSDKEIEILFESVIYREKKFTKNEIIAFSDDEVTNQLILVEGTVKGEMVDFNGKTIKIEDIESPRMLAPAFLFGQNNRYPVNIVSNNNSVVIAIPREAFLKMLQNNKIVLTNYLNSIANRAQFLSDKIRFLSFQTIKGKIAHFLLQQRLKQGGETFVLPKSHNELAEMFGVARPSLSRAFRELDNEAFIKAEGKHIEILNKEGLSKLLRD